MIGNQIGGENSCLEFCVEHSSARERDVEFCRLSKWTLFDPHRVEKTLKVAVELQFTKRKVNCSDNLARDNNVIVYFQRDYSRLTFWMINRAVMRMGDFLLDWTRCGGRLR